MKADDTPSSCSTGFNASEHRGSVRAGWFVLLAATVIFPFACSKDPLATTPALKSGQTEATVAKGRVPELNGRQPQTLQELLGLTPAQLEGVDVAVMNLLCAEGLNGAENLDIQQCLTKLNVWTKSVERETKRNFHRFRERPQEYNNSLAYYRMGMLGTVLAEDLHIRYNPVMERRLLQDTTASNSLEQWIAFFSNAQDVFINGLLGSQRSGTCASMPFLYTAIARRLGYPVTIAARKHHLYVRYEMGGGAHLNMETTENRGFGTPTDEEYRAAPFPMTQEEIDGNGWLRPLSNERILGICLLNRANCLRSMKKFEEERSVLALAVRYLPDTAMTKRVIAKNMDLSGDLQAAERWKQLWQELEDLVPPNAGPIYEPFLRQKWQIQAFMNQSTNVAVIERAVNVLRNNLKQFRDDVSDRVGGVAALNTAADKPAKTTAPTEQHPQQLRLTLGSDPDVKPQR